MKTPLAIVALIATLNLAVAPAQAQLLGGAVGGTLNGAAHGMLGGNGNLGGNDNALGFG